jgi:multimeric flavodoxin WrbA
LKPKIGIILGTTRPTRFSEKAAQWLANIAKQRDDAEFEVVDLRDYPMPFFEEERSPMLAPPKSAIALRWGKKMAELDGYIFVTAEYNHGLPAVLKNALDYAYAEYNRKPATFVGYGKRGSRTSGGAVASGSCGTAGGHAKAHRSCQRRRIHRHAYARQDLCRFPLSRRVGRSYAGKSGVVGKCPQGRASTGNARDGRSSLIARYPDASPTNEMVCASAFRRSFLSS